MSEHKPQLEMLAGLQDIRLPELAPGGLFAEIAVVTGIGLLIACGLSVLIPLISQSVARSAAPSLSDQIALVRHLSDTDRSVALLHLMQSHDPTAAAALRERLYARDGFPEPDELEEYLNQIEARRA